jgi:hypothetical protein
MQFTWQVTAADLKKQRVWGFIAGVLAAGLLALAAYQAFKYGQIAASPIYDGTLDSGLQLATMAILLFGRDRGRGFWWAFVPAFLVICVVDFILRFQLEVDDPRLDWCAASVPLAVAIVLAVQTAPTSTPASGPTTAPTSTPASGPTTAPTSTPASGPTTAPTSTPASGPTTPPTPSAP